MQLLLTLKLLLLLLLLVESSCPCFSAASPVSNPSPAMQA
jgi:hypothetical protein